MSTKPNPDPTSEVPELDRWHCDGGAIAQPTGPVTKAELLEQLDLIATKGTPLASRLAAELAARIRVRGLARS